MTDPISRDELVAIQAGHQRNADVRALLLEIRRQHEIILAAEQLRQSIDRAWKQEAGGQLAGLHSLRALLQPELGRFKR